MNRVMLFGLLAASLILSGCTVRSYSLTKDRVDQDISGNRGYLKGQPPAGSEKERKSTRTTQIVEVELRSPLKFDRAKPKAQEPAAHKMSVESTEGNRGYITQSVSPEIAEPMAASFEKYTVQKNDTLQKISQKFYGTTKKWNKIYEANKDVLKGPNRVYPGQTLNIPVDNAASAMKEPKENLK